MKALLPALLLTANLASAFTVGTALTKPCHETITMEALRNVRMQLHEAMPMPAITRDDSAIIDDVPFSLDPDMKDLAAVTLLLGVRDNDLKGKDPNELDSLALVHGDPALQSEHCLRGPTDDEPNGSDAALRQCRGYIHEQFVAALEGLDDDSQPNPESRLNLDVSLSLRGKVGVSLPRFYVHLGQALHAVQDSFTHSYRGGDRTRVTTVLNYVDVVNADYLTSRDGPEHSMELDRCDATDPLRIENRKLAVEASTALLGVALDQKLDDDEKVAALDKVLDQYLGYESGCNDPNGWCAAPESQLASQRGCGCTSGGGWGCLMIAAVMFIMGRKDQRAAAAAGATGSLVFLWLSLSSNVMAQEPAASPPIESPEAAKEGAVVEVSPTEVSAVQKEQKHHETPIAIYAGGAASYYNAGAAAMVGVRFRLSDYFQLGVDGEVNGWYGVHARQLRTGATAVYASAIVRYPLKFEQINLRSNLQAGVAVQMLDLAGVPAGSVGVFAGLNPLGVEFKLSGHLFLIFYPIGFALPVTQLNGAPFGYPQFRSTLGLEVTL
jgi:hypothetical protein